MKGEIERQRGQKMLEKEKIINNDQVLQEAKEEIAKLRKKFRKTIFDGDMILDE